MLNKKPKRADLEGKTSLIEQLIEVKCLLSLKRSCRVCLPQNRFGWTWIQLMMGFSVAFLMSDMGCLLQKGVAESMDKGTCVIYSLGPERLTKMSGNKASCYFLTAVQTCIDRYLALQIKMRLSCWRQTNQALLSMCTVCVCMCVCFHCDIQLLSQTFPLQEALRLP